MPRLWSELDERSGAGHEFNPTKAMASSESAITTAALALKIISEFETWLILEDGGPWAKRIASQKRGLAAVMESRFREALPSVLVALPTGLSKGASRGARPIPRLASGPSAEDVGTAESLLTFMNEVRKSAEAAGCAAVRARTIEELTERLDQYCEDLLNTLRRPESAEKPTAREFLEIAARFTALLQGEKSGEVVRRRAAAA